MTTINKPDILARALEVEASAEVTEPDLPARCRLLAHAVATHEARSFTWERLLWAAIRQHGPILLVPETLASIPEDLRVNALALPTGEMELSTE